VFNFADFRRILSRLDWPFSTRMSGDGTREISVHNGVLPDENLKYRIFDFANSVCRYWRLLDRLCGKIVKNCAALLFYDSRYNSVWGTSRLDKM